MKTNAKKFIFILIGMIFIMGGIAILYATQQLVLDLPSECVSIQDLKDPVCIREFRGELSPAPIVEFLKYNPDFNDKVISLNGAVAERQGEDLVLTQESLACDSPNCEVRQVTIMPDYFFAKAQITDDNGRTTSFAYFDTLRQVAETFGGTVKCSFELPSSSYTLPDGTKLTQAPCPVGYTYDDINAVGGQSIKGCILNPNYKPQNIELKEKETCESRNVASNLNGVWLYTQHRNAGKSVEESLAVVRKLYAETVEVSKGFTTPTQYSAKDLLPENVIIKIDSSSTHPIKKYLVYTKLEASQLETNKQENVETQASNFQPVEEANSGLAVEFSEESKGQEVEAVLPKEVVKDKITEEVNVCDGQSALRRLFNDCKLSENQQRKALISMIIIVLGIILIIIGLLIRK